MERTWLVFKGGILINGIIVFILLMIVGILMLIAPLTMCQISGKISRLEEAEYFTSMLDKEKEKKWRE